jgi:hypothetical protein
MRISVTAVPRRTNWLVMNRYVSLLLLMQGVCLLGAGSTTGAPIWSVGSRLGDDAYPERTDGLMLIGCLVACSGALLLVRRSQS